MWKREFLIILIFSGLALGKSKNNKTTEPVPGIDKPLGCPKYKCSDKKTDTCLNYNDTTYTYTLNDCTGDLHCSYFFLVNTQSFPCTSQVNTKIDDLTCINYAKQNEICDPGKILCHPDYFCKNNETNFYCEKRVSEGKECQFLDECKVGHICNHGECIKYWTVDDGKAADSLFACKSADIWYKTCQMTQKSVGDLPKKCKFHSDCTGSNGQTGECICAPDSEGSSYCALHQADDLTKEWLGAANDGIIEKANYLHLKATSYPVIEKVSDCYIDAAADFIPYKIAKKWHEECKSAEHLKDSGIILAISATILTAWV